MKAGKLFVRWRPAMGVLAVGALAFGLGVQGGPRGTEDAAGRTTVAVKSEVGSLVTGPSEHINSVVAGAGATMRILLTPLPAQGTQTYPAGTTISGQTLTTGAGGFGAFFAIQLEDWDPAGNGPALRTWQAKVDAKGWLGSNAVPSNPGADIALNSLACANNAACAAAYGDSASRCTGGVCDPGYQNRARADWTHASSEPDVFPAVNVGSPTGPVFAATTDPAVPTSDPGILTHGGTLVLNVPSTAKGGYTIPFVNDQTFAADPGAPPTNEIPLLAEVAAVVNIVVGQCCLNLGGAGGCVDGVTAAECAANPQTPTNFTPGADCTGPCGCVLDVHCDDSDLCTTDRCVAFACQNPPVASWDPVAECCNANDGSQDAIVSPDQCVEAKCSLPGNRGDLQLNSRTGQDCDDGNDCSYDDTCVGGAGTCAGSNSNDVACSTEADCETETGSAFPCQGGFCFCTLTPPLTFRIDPSGKDNDNCFDSGADGAKVSGTVFVGASTGAVNGGQFLIKYDPSCLDYNSVAGVAPYTQTVFGPVVNEAAGTIFIAVGVGFGAGNGPNGNAAMLSLRFTKIGDCNDCELCFGDADGVDNPLNTYLVDDEGQRIAIAGECSKVIRANGEITLDIPGNIKTNVDCSAATAVETWDAPRAADSCGPDIGLTCRGEHVSGLIYNQSTVLGGGEFPIGVSNFCCYGQNDYCNQEAGCPPDTDCARTPAGKPVGCWTVEVNDETSVDIDIQLSPGSQSKPADNLVRCIKFSMYNNSIQEPQTFEGDVTFGGLFEIVGKFTGKMKIGGHGQWECITAWDQFHTLRSCYQFEDGDCVDGQLHANFAGDPAFGGNWLISGNLDGFKKNDSAASPSLFVIDVLDFGTFVSQFNVVYPGGGDTPCGTDGPNADINGDGIANLEDYAFISQNFLKSAKLCCGVDGLPAAIGRTEVSVAELREMGLSELTAADLNRDGMLNMDDMTAFMQGARPGKKAPTDNRSGSGTR